MKTHKLRAKTNIKLYRKAKKFIHVTYILCQTTDNHLFSWRYPELACKTKYICISKQENTIYIWYFDETKNSGDAPAKTCTRMLIHWSCRVWKTLVARNKTVIISKTSSVRYPENFYMSRYILQEFMMEK
jgi:hypothetical protein